MGKGLVVENKGAGAYTVRRIKYGSTLPDETETVEDVWCADLTENLTGEVGTIEVNGESDHILITPGGEPGVGQLESATTSTASAIFWNWALHLWWQRWKPTYRVATIIDIDYDNDTCDVELAEAQSQMLLDIHGYPSAGQSINPDNPNLENVPIEYMECNSEAFGAGDSVIIKFEDQSWSQPVVIGFEEEPRACGLGIPIQFRYPQGSAAFINLADARIAELNKLKDHANYMKNTFIPALISYYNSLKGKAYGFKGFSNPLQF